MRDDADVVLGPRPDDTGSTRERRGAALFDLAIVPFAMGGAILLSGTTDVLAPWTGALLWLLLAVVESAAGGSPGKLVTGLRVERVEGNGRPGLLLSLLRRPWGALLLAVPFLPPSDGLAGNAVGLLMLATLVAMLVTIDRSSERRGFHDHLAGTRVVEGEHPPGLRRAVLGLVIALSVVRLVLQLSDQTPSLV